MEIVSLVTGGAGFIGSHVSNHLLGLGHKVVVLDDLSGGFGENINPKVEFHKGSISNQQFVESLFEKYQFTYIYHLAAYAAEGLSHFIRRFNYENNLMGSMNLINAAVNHNIKCFVFTSSIAVYGTNRLPLVETLHPQPEDPYGIAKYAVELDLANAHKMFGLDYIIFRPHNVYGPGQNIGDKYRNVVGIFMNQILKGQPLTIFGDGSQSRAFSYIDDVAPYIANSVNNPNAYNKVFNIGGNEVHTVKELALTVCKAMGVAPNLLLLEQREEVMHAYSDHIKFEEVFSPGRFTALVDGLRKMGGWVRKHGARTSNEFENIEINKNLPASWK